MPVLPEQIAEALKTAGLGTPGKDIFAHRMPSVSAIGLVVLPSLAGVAIDWDLPGWERAGFQLIARAANFPDAIALARRASDALTWRSSRTLAAVPGQGGSMIVRQCLPRHQPIAFPRTDNGLIEASVNFDYVAVPG